MKVGILLISDKFSGGERFVYEIIKRFKYNKSIEVSLFINKEIYKHYASLNNIKIIKLGKLNIQNSLFHRYSLIKMRRKLKKYCSYFDLFFLNLEDSFIVFCPIKNKVFIPVLHGGEIKDFLNNFSLRYNLLTKFFIRKILKYSSKIISVGEEQIKNIPGIYKKKTVVIPNGVDSKKFKYLRHIKQKKNVILFVGRQIDWKGIQEIINVAKQLPQYEFWFAGQGPLGNLINLPNTKNLGFKTTEELVEIYNQATICIFPSWYEPFGLVGLEAMACGRAVIATPLGFSEYIENGKDGIIIPAKDEKALKDAIVDLMTNEKKRKMLEKNARKKALQYSWDKVAKIYIKVFEEVIRK